MRAAVHQHQFAEPRQRESILGLLVSELNDAVQNLDGLLLSDSVFFRDRGRDLRFRECFSHSLFSVCC